MKEIIKGIDGYYVVKDGKLLKILEVEFSDKYLVSSDGWAIYELENGEKIKIE